MIKWKYKGRSYYLNHSEALILTCIFIVLPLIYGWIEGFVPGIFYDKIFLITFVITMLFYIYAIFKTCVDSYEPYYYDENGKRINGEEPVELKKKRMDKLKSK